MNGGQEDVLADRTNRVVRLALVPRAGLEPAWGVAPADFKGAALPRLNNDLQKSVRQTDGGPSPISRSSPLAGRTALATSQHESHRARFARRLSRVTEVQLQPPMQGCFRIGLVIVVVITAVMIAADLFA